VRADCPLCAGFDGCFSRFFGFQAELSRGCTPLMEDQSVEVSGEVGKREVGLCSGDADDADEEATAVILMGEDMLDLGVDR